MDAVFITAGESDLPELLLLLREFYAIEHLNFDETVARAGLLELFKYPELGLIHLMRVQGQTAGYVVLTFGFSLEFHGRDALVDELYVREPFQGKGVGRAALAFVEGICATRGLAAVHLEVDRANIRAQEIYRRAGYRDHDRFLLTKWLR